MKITRIGRDEMEARIPRLIAHTDIVLDIGCGLRPQEFFKPRLHVCCEPCAEYVDILKKWFEHSDGFLVVKALGNEFLKQLVDRSVDSIFLVDVVEHLTKEDGLALLRECNRVARRQIVVFTPWGFMRQDYEEGAVDGWGFNGALWQRHLSGWDDKDFDDSWELLVCDAFHTHNGKGEPIVPPHGAFWAIRNIPPETKRGAKLAVVLPAGATTPEMEQAIGSAFREPDAAGYIMMSVNDFLANKVDEFRMQIGRHSRGIPMLPEPGRFIRLVKRDPVPAPETGRIRRWRQANLAWHDFQAQVTRSAADIERHSTENGCQAIIGVGGDALNLAASALAAVNLHVPFGVYFQQADMVANWSAEIVGPEKLLEANRQALRSARCIMAADAGTAVQVRSTFGIECPVAAPEALQGGIGVAMRQCLFPGKAQ